MFSAVKIITKAVSDIKHARVRQTKLASLFDHPGAGATQAISGLLSGLLKLSNVPCQDKDVVHKINEASKNLLECQAPNTVMCFDLGRNIGMG
jgi:hypothetical protein